MLRLGRVGEVRGTMTGRDGIVTEPGRPTPTPGETGCRTRGEDETRGLGRDDEVRVLGREEEYRELGIEVVPLVVGAVEGLAPAGRSRPLGEASPELGKVRGSRRSNGLELGSTGERPALPLPDTERPGR
jgi:hypothetical protein